jgi:hypothetical protein
MQEDRALPISSRIKAALSTFLLLVVCIVVVVCPSVTIATILSYKNTRQPQAAYTGNDLHLVGLIAKWNDKTRSYTTTKVQDITTLSVRSWRDSHIQAEWIDKATGEKLSIDGVMVVYFTLEGPSSND